MKVGENQSTTGGRETGRDLRLWCLMPDWGRGSPSHSCWPMSWRGPAELGADSMKVSSSRPTLGGGSCPGHMMGLDIHDTVPSIPRFLSLGATAESEARARRFCQHLHSRILSLATLPLVSSNLFLEPHYSQ